MWLQSLISFFVNLEFYCATGSCNHTSNCKALQCSLSANWCCFISKLMFAPPLFPDNDSAVYLPSTAPLPSIRLQRLPFLDPLARTPPSPPSQPLFSARVGGGRTSSSRGRRVSFRSAGKGKRRSLGGGLHLARSLEQRLRGCCGQMGGESLRRPDARREKRQHKSSPLARTSRRC